MKATDFDWCDGMTSVVEERDSGMVRGQLLMLDMDDVELETVREEVSRLPQGHYVIQRSSENSYNVISLNFFSFWKCVEIKSGVYHDDAHHLKIGVHRSKWIIRLSKKGEKSRPEFVEYVNTEERDAGASDIPVSGSAIEVLTGLYKGLFDVLPAFNNVVETKVKRVKYPSLAEREEGMDDLWRELEE